MKEFAKKALLCIGCVLSTIYCLILVSLEIALLPAAILVGVIMTNVKRFRNSLNIFRHWLNDFTDTVMDITPWWEPYRLMFLMLRLYSFIFNLEWRVFVREGGA